MSRSYSWDLIFITRVVIFVPLNPPRFAKPHIKPKRQMRRAQAAMPDRKALIKNPGGGYASDKTSVPRSRGLQ